MKKILIISCLLLLSSCNFTSLEVLEVNSRHTKLSIKDKIPQDFFPEELSIVALGDSLTKGIGSENVKGGYTNYLKTNLNMEKSVLDTELVNYGISGHRSDQLLEKLSEEKIIQSIKEANLTIITIGGNDLIQVAKRNFLNLQLDPFVHALSQYENNLDEILQRLTSLNNDMKIVLLGIYNPFYTWFSDVEEFSQIVDLWNETSAELIKNYDNGYFVTVSQEFEELGDEILYEDNFHPNDHGYELIANKLSNKISEQVVRDIVMTRNQAYELGYKYEKK